MNDLSRWNDQFFQEQINEFVCLQKKIIKEKVPKSKYDNLRVTTE